MTSNTPSEHLPFDPAAELVSSFYLSSSDDEDDINTCEEEDIGIYDLYDRFLSRADSPRIESGFHSRGSIPDLEDFKEYYALGSDDLEVSFKKLLIALETSTSSKSWESDSDSPTETVSSDDDALSKPTQDYEEEKAIAYYFPEGEESPTSTDPSL